MTTVAALENYQSPTLSEPSAPTSQVPLTDDEILDRYSPLLWQALIAFATDPGYFTEISQAANRAERRVELSRASTRLAALRKSLGDKVQVDGECWTWTASRTNKGVPQMHRPGTSGSASKITARSWTVEQWRGPDETRWMISASCGNRLCVNPEHATWRTVTRDDPQTCR